MQPFREPIRFTTPFFPFFRGRERRPRISSTSANHPTHYTRIAKIKRLSLNTTKKIVEPIRPESVSPEPDSRCTYHPFGRSALQFDLRRTAGREYTRPIAFFRLTLKTARLRFVPRFISPINRRMNGDSLFGAEFVSGRSEFRNGAKGA